MINKTGFLILFLIVSFPLSAQDFFKAFNIQQPEKSVSGSLYDSIELVDSRIDKTNMGIVMMGLGNTPAKVVADIPLQKQLNDYLKMVAGTTPGQGTLLLQIRQFVFYEISESYSKKGYCHLRANLFAKKNDNYVQLISVDTLAILSKSLDVTNSLMKTGSHLITDMIMKFLFVPPVERSYISHHEIIKMDSLEKRRIPVYNTSLFSEGLYYNYQSFKNQMPDNSIIVKTKKDSTISQISVLDDNGKAVKLRNGSFYAIVYKGKPYISTGFGLYPIHKNNDKLYFVGRIMPMTYSSTDITAAAISFGMIGGMIAAAANPSGETYFIVIDHHNGNFIPIKRMPPLQN